MNKDAQGRRKVERFESNWKCGLNGDQRFANLRYLDPGNPKSLKKRFYSPNIVAEFDKHYTLKDS